MHNLHDKAKNNEFAHVNNRKINTGTPQSD